MGHILCALPRIEDYHLHSRLARKLMSREHRPTLLAGDPIAFEFYCRQGLACLDLAPGAGTTAGDQPLYELAGIDLRLQGRAAPSPDALRRRARWLARRLPPLERLFDRDPPDLVFLHHARHGLGRLVHGLARQRQIPVLHTGPGLLPLTMQIDTEGIDGDASFAGANASDYRRVQSDKAFLDAATAAWLGRAYPPPLARIGLSIPPLLSRWRACCQALWRGQPGLAAGGVRAWQRAWDLGVENPPALPRLPPGPFAVVLLQADDDPRLRLDASHAPSIHDLVQKVGAAVREVDPELQLLVVRPEAAGAGAWADSQPLELPSTAGPLAVATAAVVITINHPLGLAAILAGTPVLHLGRTPYGVPGISLATSLDLLGDDLKRAIGGSGRVALTERFLTGILKEHHVWCSPRLPDNNGIAGLVLRMEKAMRSPKRRSRPLPYRAGPVWPLSVGSGPSIS